MAATVSESPKSAETTPAVWAEAQETAIRGQLDRLLSNSFFSHSRRIPAFLQYIVETTLKGQADLLKERTIGIEIFGKAPDYDTAADPIVRVTAGDLRKRIAQYYQEPGHESELRFSLPTGSYIPHFHFPGVEAQPAETEMPEEPFPSLSGASPSSRRIIRRSWVIAAAAALALIAAVIAVPRWRLAQRSAFDEFWGPILQSPDPVLLCVADQTQYTEISLRDAQDPERQIVLKDNLTAVVIDDLSAVVKIGGVLQSSSKHYSLRGENDTTLMDLRSGPSILIGAFDNAWTLRMLRPLRFHFADNPPDMTLFSIVDSAQHGQARWIVDRRQQIATNNYVDYAIVARFTDDVTGKPTLIAAGIARGGTVAAGDFLTNPDLLHAVLRQRPSTHTGNVEVVLSAQIINGEPGTPRIEAVYFW
jgi:hypothetical protein